MDFNNNPFLYPKEDGLNPLKPIVERLSTLESTVKNYEDSFETKQLNVTENATVENLNATEGNITTLESTDATVANLDVTNDNIENATVENLHVTENAKIDNLINDEPILSNAVVGYDVNGKLIPITVPQGTESALYFDYTVDSQEKFDDLLTILKSGTPNTYKSIAIVGGYGDGEHGEYLYTIDSDSGEANLNNASVVGFNNPKIVITADDADTFKVFKNGSFKYITFDVGGTVLADNHLTLISNSKVESCEILHNETPINFIIESSTLTKTVNNEYITFDECTLNECETIQSAFTNCSSEMLYVKTDSNIASKYSFNKCGIHLDMKKTDMTQLETVTINISSLVNTSLTVLDESSKLKKIILNVDDSDILSSVVGNNGKDYSVYHGYFEQIRKSISPSMRDKAYICTRDTTFTPIFSANGTDFYIDENMTIPVYAYGLSDADNKRVSGFTTDTNILQPINNRYYTDLSFTKFINGAHAIINIPFNDYGTFKMPNYANEYILNGTSVKEFHIKGESSNTILYSSDNGTTLRLNPELLDTDGNVIGCYTLEDVENNSVRGYGLMIDYSILGNNLYFYSLDNKLIFDAHQMTAFTPDLLEISIPKDNYNVQVVSNYNAKLNVENAFFTKVKND